MDLTRTDFPPFWFPEEPLDLLPATPLLLVGWLEGTVPTRGPVEEVVLSTLFAAELRMHYLSDHSCGSHACALCVPPRHRPRVRHGDREVTPTGHGFYLVEHCGKAYVAPRLLLHYMVDHGYCPPDEFLTAVCDGRFVADTRPTVPLSPPPVQLPLWILRGAFTLLFTAVMCGLIWFLRGGRF